MDFPDGADAHDTDRLLGTTPWSGVAMAYWHDAWDGADVFDLLVPSTGVASVAGRVLLGTFPYRGREKREEEKTFMDQTALYLHRTLQRRSPTRGPKTQRRTRAVGLRRRVASQGGP